MDDIVYAPILEQHNERLKRVFEILCKANLKLNREKYLFGVHELTFLGVVVSSEGLKPDPLKVRAIKEFQRPTTKKEVQSFLAMVNYQRQFISR